MKVALALEGLKNVCSLDLEGFLSQLLKYVWQSIAFLGNKNQGSKLSFVFQGAQLHLQKLPKGAVYRNQYIFGLPAEI